MKYYDVDGDGNISYEEFIRGLRYLKVTDTNVII
jgi:Ca2+-binding EF-hand superfamily protein